MWKAKECADGSAWEVYFQGIFKQQQEAAHQLLTDSKIIDADS